MMPKPADPADTLRIEAHGDREFHTERIVNAPRDRVWRALTDPALLVQWWGGGGGTVVIERMEPERGGHWRFVEHQPEGVAEGFEGRFREVTPPERIVQTFEWDGMPGHVAIETIVLEDLGDGRTWIRTTSLFHTTEERDGFLQSGVEQGMRQHYAKLDALLAGMGRASGAVGHPALS